MTAHTQRASRSRVFVHGTGRRGERAWPHADRSDARFISFPAESGIHEQVAHLKAEIGRTRPVIFAHSIGAVPLVLAAAALQPRALVLVEPALYDTVRGDAAIERHIAIVTEARAQAPRDLAAFWAILRPLMFGGTFDSALWPTERPLAARWATTNVPWGHDVRAELLRSIPTLVVTGGWNEEYEAIAHRLVAEGARHQVLVGADHRPQDVDGFAELVEGFERSLL